MDFMDIMTEENQPQTASSLLP